MKIVDSVRSLSGFERGLWLSSVTMIVLSFLWGSESRPLTLLASVIGVTALIFVAKGDVLGQVLTVVFSLFYAVISLKLRYYSEAITYLGMTTPMAVVAAVAWWRHPYDAREVAVAVLDRRQVGWMLLAAAVVTAVFYGILKALNTAQLALSTVSIATSFLASYLTARRSSYYALAYAANDAVLIFLWSLAVREDSAYLPMVACFATFLVNDLYGYVNWKRMQNRQTGGG